MFVNPKTQNEFVNLLAAYNQAQAAKWLSAHLPPMIGEIEQQIAQIEPAITEAQASYEAALSQAETTQKQHSAGGPNPSLELTEAKLGAARQAAALHNELTAVRRRAGELTDRRNELQRLKNAVDNLAHPPGVADVEALLQLDLTLKG